MGRLFYLFVLFPLTVIGAAAGGIGPVKHVWSTNYNFTLKESLQDYLTTFNEEKAGLVRKDKAELKPYALGTKNNAYFRIFYTNAAGTTQYEFTEGLNKIYVSGWNDGLGDCCRQLGQSYPTLTTAVLQDISFHNEDMDKLRKDFNDQEHALEATGAFNFENYAHSEQAFLSDVLRSGMKIHAQIIPKSIVINVVSYKPACPACRGALEVLIKGNTALKKRFIQQLFPSVDDGRANTMPIYIIYTSANMEMLNLAEMIDLRNDLEYKYIESRR